jgi:hypothetical protein
MIRFRNTSCIRRFAVFLIVFSSFAISYPGQESSGYRQGERHGSDALDRSLSSGPTLSWDLSSIGVGSANEVRSLAEPSASRVTQARSR